MKALLIAALLIAQAPSAAPAAEDPAARRLRVFDHVWSEIRDNYYEPALNGTDWEAVRTRYRPQVPAAASESAFYTLLRAAVGELRDAHTRVLTAAEARARRRDQTHSAGVYLFEVEGRAVVFDLAPGGSAEQAGLRRGTIVLAVDGVPVAEALQRARAEVGPSSSDRASLVLTYLRLISGPPEEPLRLTLAGTGGRPVEVALARRPVERRPHFEARRLPSGILYVRFDRFRAPVARLFREALAQNADAPGLVLDLRSNTGGDGREGMRLIGPLLDRPTLIARLITRSGRPPSALLGLVRLPLEMRAGEAGAQIYGGPVVVLVNQATASTSEVIAASLQERGRAHVVGTRSCGCALGVLRYRRLPDGGALAISEIGIVSGSGRRIEGAGVAPDETVALRVRDFTEGRDPALERAISLLAR